MSEPRRWTIYGFSRMRSTSDPRYFGIRPSRVEPPLEAEETIEVMPVEEHKRWREAFLEGQHADHARCREIREVAQAVIAALDAGRIVQVPDDEPCPELDALRAVLESSPATKERS